MKKHILCLGDSNTHGYCADPADCADGGIRFNEDERWTCLLQKKLGDAYLVIEEGLSGRTTVFPDPLHEGMPALPILAPLLKSHEKLDLLVVMLGTNDTKDRFAANGPVIALGMERLLRKAMSIDCWTEDTPHILLVAPPPMGEGFFDPCTGYHSRERSLELAPCYQALAERMGIAFLDANGCEFNSIDKMHLTRLGHAQLAERIYACITGKN